MPRTPRVFVDGGMYHVYNRLARGERSFADPTEADAFVDVMSRVKKRDRLTIYAWCVLPTHYHALLTTSNRPLWRSMSTLGHTITRRINRKAGVRGPGWQSRYKSKLVTDQTYFDRLVVYIHLNPVVAGLVEDPGMWRWSGHWEIVRRKQAALIDADQMLDGFGSTWAAARQRYVATLRAGQGRPWIGEHPGRLPWWWGEAPSDEPLQLRQHSSSHDDVVDTAAARPSITTADVVDAVSREIGVRRARLSGSGKDRLTTRARRVLASVACDRYGLPVRSVAAELGKRPDAVSVWLRTAAVLLASSTSLSDLVDRVDRRLQERAEVDVHEE